MIAWHVVSLWKRSSGLIWILSPSIFTEDDFKPRVTAWFFFWNVYSEGVVPFIDVNIMSSIATALSTLAVGWAYTPVAILHKLGSSWMGFAPADQCVFPVMCLSCCCHILILLPSVVVNPSELLHCLINFCTGGLDNKHNSHWCSIIPCPLSTGLQLLMRTCSIMRSDERPAHRRLLLQVTCNPLLKCCWTSGCWVLRFDICCK